MAERKSALGSDAWFKELENRLAALAAKLSDASSLVSQSTNAQQRIDRHLAIVQEHIAGIEERLAGLAADIGTPDTGDPDVGVHEPAVAYRDVPGFSGYRVGSDGSVWGSRSTGRGYGRTRDWRKLKPYLVRPGPALTVSLYRDRTRHATRLDALVLFAFLGPCPDGYEVWHDNGDAFDSRRENLRYARRATPPSS